VPEPRVPSTRSEVCDELKITGAATTPLPDAADQRVKTYCNPRCSAAPRHVDAVGFHGRAASRYAAKNSHSRPMVRKAVIPPVNRDCGRCRNADSLWLRLYPGHPQGQAASTRREHVLCRARCLHQLVSIPPGHWWMLRRKNNPTPTLSSSIALALAALSAAAHRLPRSRSRSCRRTCARVARLRSACPARAPSTCRRPSGVRP